MSKFRFPKLIGASTAVLLTISPAIDVSADDPVRIIYDTDMHIDVDDVGGLAVLHVLADRGECEILAVMCSSKDPYAAATADALNTWYGRPDIPIGALKDDSFIKTIKYTRGVAAEFPHDYPDQDSVPDATLLYRDILKEQKGKHVVIVTAGYLTNIKNLLVLPRADGFPSGYDLVERKVEKWVCMGGNFLGTPAVDNLERSNVNFRRDAPATYFSIDYRPSLLVFAGREMCSSESGLAAGANLINSPERAPCFALTNCFGEDPQNRHVADLATVLFAVRGVKNYWDFVDQGSMDLNPDTSFQWNPEGERNQADLLKRTRNGELNDRNVEKTIDELLTQLPKRLQAPK